MATVASYFNFDGTCEEAFALYRDALGGEFDGPPMYMRDMPVEPGQPPLSEEEGGRVMHMALTLPGGHQLMGTDVVPSMGMTLTRGNAMYVTLTLDDEDALHEIFAKLSEGGVVTAEPTPMFWGDLYTDFFDRYGIQWMLLAPITEGQALA